jgi:NadR type nicotinamide-nucleotide adenylyltransferase
MEKESSGNNRKIIRIAVTGPESTGKSTLAEGLARYFHTVYNPEYAREYLDKINRPYTFEDIEKIAQFQLQNEIELIKSARNLIVADTEFIVIKVWMDHKYGKCPNWIIKEIEKNPYDLYLLCDIDIPWQPDPQREHPHLREYFKKVYIRKLEKLKANYLIISGNIKEREDFAVSAIKKLCDK